MLINDKNKIIHTTMYKRGLTLFLQGVIVIFGTGVLAALLWEPQFEGRNVHATQFEIYFADPFLAFVYLGSFPFFIGLYHAYGFLGYVRENKLFSQKAVNALRKIKYCALVTAGAIVAVDTFLMMAARGGNDDPAGAIALGVVATFAALVIVTATAVFERVLQNVVNIKSENDVTG